MLQFTGDLVAIALLNDGPRNLAGTESGDPSLVAEGPDDFEALLLQVGRGNFDGEPGRTVRLSFDGNFHGFSRITSGRGGGTLEGERRVVKDAGRDGNSGFQAAISARHMG